MSVDSFDVSSLNFCMHSAVTFHATWHRWITGLECFTTREHTANGYPDRTLKLGAGAMSKPTPQYPNYPPPPRRQPPFRPMDQPQGIHHNRLAFAHLNRILPRKGLPGVAGEYGKAEATGDRFEDEGDLVGEAGAAQGADAGGAGEAAGEQAVGHGVAVGVVDEAEGVEVGPGVGGRAGGGDEFERFFGEAADGEAGVVGAEGDEAEFELVVEYGGEHVPVGREAVADAQAGVLLLQVEQAGVEGEADAAGGDEADFALGGVVVIEALLQAQVGGCDLGAVVEQGAAGGGELDLARAADEQRAELRFEPLHMLADGGLGEVEMLGRAGEVAHLGEGSEGAEPLRI